MPSLFGSRRRGSSAQPPVDRSTTSSAALAASQAMFQQRTASMTLSSAAAAAALRSQTTTPEPVGSIQTKRMVRRGSVSSVGSGSVISTSRGGYTTNRPGLSRQNSSGSMTERTFRVQSPAGRNGSLAPVTHTAPPVPPLPSSVSTSGSQRRSNSLEPPMRMTSPGPATNGRSMSVDRRSNPPAAAKPSGSHRGSKRLSDVAEMNEPSDSNRRVNFSRPISPSASSPPASPINARSSYANGTTASPASARSMRPSPITTNAAAAPRDQEVVMVFDAATRTFVPRVRDKPKPVEPASPLLPPPKALQPGDYDASTRSIVPGALTPATLAALAASNAPVPSATASSPSQPVSSAPEAAMQPPPRHPGRALSPTGSYTGRSPRQDRETPLPAAVSNHQPPARLAPLQTSTVSQAAAAPSAKASSSLSPAVTPQKASGLRNGSSSPSPASRSAHFSVSPVIEAIRHNPPPRDLSPVKSALKHPGSPASSLRAASPLAHLGRPASVYSEAGSVTSQDGGPSSATKKKKSVRVSFDEQAMEIAPENATPAPAAPRRTLEDSDDEDAETMKPRPALPNFGSVRRTSREYPAGDAAATTVNPSSSSDLAIGTVLANSTLTKKIADEAEVPLKHDAAATATSDPTDSEDFPAIKLQPPTPGEEGQPLGEAAETAAVEDPAAAVVAADLLTPIGEDSDDSEKDFSDAAEELAPAIADEEEHSEAENGGFISLDAVAVSPVHSRVAATTASTVRPLSYADVTPTSTPTKHQRASVAASEGAIDGKGSGDWTEATAYWKQLSRQQREKIEREHAAVEDEEEGEGPTAPPAVTSAPIAVPTALEKSPDIIPAPAAAKPKVIAASPAVKIPAKQTSVAPPVTQTAPQPAFKKTLRAQPAAPAPAPPAEGEVRMRRSMRDGGGMMSGGASLRNRSASASSRQEQPQYSRAPVAAAPVRPSPVTRLSSTGSIGSTASRATAPPTRPGPMTRLSSTASTASRTPAPPVVSARLQKELANDSDSESSFKKKRRSAANGSAASGRYSMKRSMRAGAGGAAAAPAAEERRPFASQQRAQSPPGRGKGRDSFSVRSLSPTGSFFGRRKNRSGSVDASAGTRMSLRNGSAGTGFTAAKSNGRPTSAQPVAPAAASRFRSRFGRDSDDEDDAGARPARTGGGFRSRFADSDDEDDTREVLTPVRGIPRAFGRDDGDSTDLDGEADEDPRKASRKRERYAAPGVPDPADVDRAMEAARRKLGIPAPEETHANLTSVTSAVAEPKSRPEDLRNNDNEVPPASPTTEKKRRGLMSSLLRRNRGSTASVPTIDLTQRNSTSSPVPPGSPLPLGTPTKKEQRLMALAAEAPSTPTNAGNRTSIVSASPPILPPIRRGNSNYSTMTAPDAWPLGTPLGGESIPPVPKIPADRLRPSTSDGGFADPRRNSVRFSEAGDETFGLQTPNSAKVGPPGVEVYSARTGKKKRFPALRRAFGLND